MAENKRFLKAVWWAYTSSWGDRVFSALFVFILATLLGPRDFGMVSVGMVYIMFLQMLLDQGYTAALVQKKDLKLEHLDAVFWMNIVLSLVLIAISILLSGWWAAKNHAPDAARLISALSLCIPIEALARVQAAVMSRNMDFKRLSIRSNVAVIIGGVVGMAMAFAHFGGWALVGQQVAKDFAALLLLWKLSKWRPRFQFSGRHLKELTGFAISNFIAGFAVFADGQGSSVVIGLFFGPFAVGLYRLADRFVGSVVAIATSSIQSVSLPEFSRLQDQPQELRQSALTCVRLSSSVALPALSVMAAVSGELMASVGPKWILAARALPLLCVGGMSSVLAYFTGPLLQALAKTKMFALVEWIRAAVGVILLLLAGLIVENRSILWQITGIALARSVTMSCLVAPAFVYILMRLCGISVRDLISAAKPSIYASLSAVVMIGLLRLFEGNSTSHPVVHLIAHVVMGGAVGLGMVLFLDVQLREMILSLLQRRGSPPVTSCEDPRNRTPAFSRLIRG